MTSSSDDGVDVADDNGVTPLYFCVLKDQMRAAIMLVRRGARWDKLVAGGATTVKGLAEGMGMTRFVGLFEAMERVREKPDAVLEIEGETVRGTAGNGKGRGNMGSYADADTMM